MSAPNGVRCLNYDSSGERHFSLVETLSRFSLVGVAATATYFVGTNLLISATALPPARASIAAYLCSMIVSFAGQSRFTFLVESPTWGHIARFCVMSVAGLFVSWISVLAAEAVDVSPFWATVVTSVAIPALSFLVMKLWVFPGGNARQRNSGPWGRRLGHPCHFHREVSGIDAPFRLELSHVT